MSAVKTYTSLGQGIAPSPRWHAVVSFPTLPEMWLHPLGA